MENAEAVRVVCLDDELFSPPPDQDLLCFPDSIDDPVTSKDADGPIDPNAPISLVTNERPILGELLYRLFGLMFFRTDDRQIIIICRICRTEVMAKGRAAEARVEQLAEDIWVVDPRGAPIQSVRIRTVGDMTTPGFPFDVTLRLLEPCDITDRDALDQMFMADAAERVLPHLVVVDDYVAFGKPHGLKEFGFRAFEAFIANHRIDRMMHVCLTQANDDPADRSPTKKLATLFQNKRNAWPEDKIQRLVRFCGSIPWIPAVAPGSMSLWSAVLTPFAVVIESRSAKARRIAAEWISRYGSESAGDLAILPFGNIAHVDRATRMDNLRQFMNQNRTVLFDDFGKLPADERHELCAIAQADKTEQMTRRIVIGLSGDDGGSPRGAEWTGLQSVFVRLCDDNKESSAVVISDMFATLKAHLASMSLTQGGGFAVLPHYANALSRVGLTDEARALLVAEYDNDIEGVRSETIRNAIIQALLLAVREQTDVLPDTIRAVIGQIGDVQQEESGVAADESRSDPVRLLTAELLKKLTVEGRFDDYATIHRHFSALGTGDAHDAAFGFVGAVCATYDEATGTHEAHHTGTPIQRLFGEHYVRAGQRMTTVLKRVYGSEGTQRRPQDLFHDVALQRKRAIDVARCVLQCDNVQFTKRPGGASPTTED